MAGSDDLITREHLSDDFLEEARADAPVAAAAAPAAMPALAAQTTQALTDPATGAAVQPPAADAPARGPAWSPAPAQPQRSLETMELDAIRLAVEQAQGNISEASKRLGISRNTIYRKLRWKVAG